MEFGLLGPLSVRDGSRPVAVSAPRQRVLLAALVLSAGRVVSLEALAELLWEGEPPAGARGALHSAVQRLRSTLGPAGPDLIETRPPGYLFQPGECEIDVRTFGVLAERGYAAAEAGAWPQAAGLLREALALWRGEALADVPSKLLRDREVPPLEDQRLQALTTRIDADLHLGRHSEILAELRQLVAAHPLHEQFPARLMLSLYRSGRQGDALAAFQDARRTLAEELGVDPGPDLQLLHQRILAADADLLLDAARTAAALAPAATDPAASLHPAPASQRPAVVPRQLPVATRHFAGRAEALKALSELADEAVAGVSQATAIAIIHGTAGVGKTTLALHFAHQVAGRFPDGQLYVNLRGHDPAGPPVAPAEAVRLFLDALSVSGTQIPTGLESQTGLYRSLLAGKRMLVLLDNARDDDQVRPLLPASPGCLVVVTSRGELASLVTAEGAMPLALDVLSDTEAHELLARRLGPERVAVDPAATSELIGLCARLPLALSIAAARTASRAGLSLAGLTADLRDAQGRLDALDAGHAAANARAVFSWSYHQLDSSAARLFRLLGLHPGPDISAAAAASLAGVSALEGRRHLGELIRAQLLTEHAPGRFTCHDLLRAYAAEMTRSEESEVERRAATARVLDHYLHTAHTAALRLHSDLWPITLGPLQPGTRPEHIATGGAALSWFQAERRVLIAAAAWALEAGFDTHAWQIPWALARFLDMRGLWHDWIANEQIALRAAERLGDPAALASAHQNVGFVRARLGDYEDAYVHLELALKAHIERGDRTGQAYVRNALALTLGFQERYEEALEQAQQALASYTAVGDRPGRALTLNSAGWFLTMTGQYEQALSYGEQAVDLFRELGDRDGIADALHSLGYAHHQLGRYAEAVDRYQQGLDLHREIGGRWGVAETLGHLGDTHQAAGRPQEARAAWVESLAILDELGLPDVDGIRAKLAAS